MIFHQFNKFSIKKINIIIIMDETNFNADDYTVEELEKIFDLEKPYSKTDLDAVANDFIETYMKKNHRDYVLFFQKAKFILEAEITKEEMNYKTPTSNTFVSRNEMEKYNIIDRSKLLSQNNPVKIGTLNQTEHSVMTQIVNIDSQYRRIFDNSGALCENGIDIGPGDSQYVNNSEDFIIDLSEPLTNVLDMSLHSIELPHSWYTFSSDYGTNSFVIEHVDCIGMHSDHNVANYNNGTYTCIIPNGNYTANELVNTINGVLQIDFATTVNSFGLPIRLIYNPNTNKIQFQVHWNYFNDWPAGIVRDPITNTQFINIKFYGPEFNSTCSNGGGGKIDYNLGWLMGFRKKEYKIVAVTENPSNNTVIESITGESLVDTYGSRYVLLYVDEYINNRVTQGLISLTNNKDKFELPDYFKKKACVDETEDIQSREGTNASTTPIKNQLTQAQEYTVNQIKHAQNILNQDRYYSPTSSDILARLPINKSNNFGVVVMGQNQIGENKREYFGPVRIRRLHIKLLNDKGIPLNLNDMNWSFALKINYLYKY
ncbi:MAG: hypothetical protein CML42_06515 [Rhodobacteraceae bacterium]|nr:hypothetical protein [Paracoccaceae bacterium]